MWRVVHVSEDHHLLGEAVMKKGKLIAGFLIG